MAATLEDFCNALALVLRPIIAELHEQQTKQQPAPLDVLTQNEVAKLLKVTRQTVSAYQKAGILTPYRLKGGRTPYYLRSDIEKLFKTQKH